MAYLTSEYEKVRELRGIEMSHSIRFATVYIGLVLRGVFPGNDVKSRFETCVTHLAYYDEFLQFLFADFERIYNSIGTETDLKQLFEKGVSEIEPKILNPNDTLP